MATPAEPHGEQKTFSLVAPGKRLFNGMPLLLRHLHITHVLMCVTCLHSPLISKASGAKGLAVAAPILTHAAVRHARAHAWWSETKKNFFLCKFRAVKNF